MRSKEKRGKNEATVSPLVSLRSGLSAGGWNETHMVCSEGARGRGEGIGKGKTSGGNGQSRS